MRNWKKIVAVCVIIVAIAAGILFWAYRHPSYDYEASGTLTSIPTICKVDTYFNLPVPYDITVNWHEWAEALISQHYLYEENYISHEVIYNTYVRDGETIVEFFGTGTTDNNEQLQIRDKVILPYELYGVK